MIQTPNLTLYFLDSSSRLRQLQTSDPTDNAWRLGPSDSGFNVLSASQLASYSCGHPSYPDYSNAWFQDDNSYYNIIDSSGTKQQVDNTLATGNGINLAKPPPNSSLTIVPHYVYNYNTTAKGPPYISLFYVNSDKLYEYHYNNTKFDFMSKSALAAQLLPLRVAETISAEFFDDQTLLPSANIAGFSWGYNDTRGAPNGLQVLYTMPDTGGISVMRLHNGRYNWESTGAADATNPFQGVARYSAVAATQAGRIYAVVEDGGTVELREWEYSEDGDTYTLLGRVNTQVR